MARLKRKTTKKDSLITKILKTKFFRHLIAFIKCLSQDKISAYASEAALFTIISFFPFLMLFFIIVSYTSLTPAFIIRLLNDSFPQDFIKIAMTVVDQLNHTSSTVITITAITGVWSASAGFFAIIKGLDDIYKTKKTRGFLWHRFFALLYTLGFCILLFLCLSLLVFGNKLYVYIINHVPVISNLAIVINGVRVSVLLSILFFFFLVIYLVLPNRKSNIIFEIPGALLASIGWVGFSTGFSYYIDNVSNMSYVYGSLSTIVMLLLWVYFCMYILFIGGEFNQYLYSYLSKKYEVTPNNKIKKIKELFIKFKITRSN